MAKSRIIFSCALLLFYSGVTWAQTVNRYMVFFKDKEETPFVTTNPIEFLSQRSIDRRTRQGIAITEKDLPVNMSYIQGVKTAGANVFYTTRWMNGVLVQCNASLVTTLLALPYVEKVEFVAPNPRLLNGRKKSYGRAKSVKGEVTDTQLSMIDINLMHADGYRGEGISIAVFDSGFQGVDVNTPFQPLFTEGRIDLSLSHDFVFNTSNVFQYDDHGAEVFSVMAAYQPGVFTGGAYGARYQLYVTEDVGSEYRVEEYNWLFAAERADSAGVDIINASLGYNTFDDESMDYEKSAMDGKTAVISRAAQMAFDRGMVIVTSAGNEGSIPWQIITAPADGPDILAIASVNAEGMRVGSSSKGPSADGRVKPDVAAMGSFTSVIQPDGSLGNTSGTSLASPIIASLAAGIWQRYPHLTNKEIISLIRRSGSQASTPDNLLGYGVPTYKRIELILAQRSENPFEVYPNPTSSNTITITPFGSREIDSCRVELLSVTGQSLLVKDFTFSQQVSAGQLSLANQTAGMYIVRVFWEGQIFTYKIIKQ